MENYDEEFLGFMKTKYGLTLEEATNGQEPQIIKFAIAWNVWKQAKKVYSQNKETSISKFMSDDHSRLDSIFQEFKKSQKAGEAKQLFLEFEMGIKRHIGWEEDILFPLAKQKLGNDSAMVDELIMQHRRIKDDIKEISSHLGTRNTGLETDLEQLLTGHDKMEEDGMYLWIDDYIEGKAKREALSKMV
ncbi:MAG: hemerythrin domain-containing protein [Candidatus Micrarchaeaceae archaeon]